MRCDRAPALEERIKDPAHCAGQKTMKERELPDRWRSPLADFEDREASWQALRAQIQLPGAAD